MFFRECNVCGYPMDPGEGKNGICDDCLEQREHEQRRREEVNRMIVVTGYKQMEMEEFING